MTIEDPSPSDHGYQLLPLATSQLVGNNSELDVLGTCSPALFIVGGGKVMTFTDPSLSIPCYQLLPLATCKLMGDNNEFVD